MVRFLKPVAYQENGGCKKFAKVAYAVNGDEYGVKVGKYDQTKQLIIDTVLAARFLGGSRAVTDFPASALVLDTTGNVYVSAINGSSDFPSIGAQGTAADSRFRGGNEVFVAKLDADLRNSRSHILGRTSW